MLIPDFPNCSKIDLVKHPECRHLGLVCYWAKKIQRRFQEEFPGIDPGELFSVGWIALQICFHSTRFDPTKGTLDTYLVRAIKNDMIDYTVSAYSTGIRLPAGISYARWLALRGELKSNRYYSQKTVNRAQFKVMRKRSLETLKCLERGLDRFIDQEAVAWALQFVRDDESRKVLELRYGLNGEAPHSAKEAGEKLNLSERRVWWLTERALQDIREGTAGAFPPPPTR